MSQIPMEDAPFEEAKNVMPKEHSVPPVQHEDAAALGSLEFTAQEVILEPVTTQSPVEQHMPEEEEPKAGRAVVSPGLQQLQELEAIDIKAEKRKQCSLHEPLHSAFSACRRYVAVVVKGRWHVPRGKP